MTAPAADTLWLGIGLLGQMLFTMRFFIQWIASERARRSVIPRAFWTFSIVGGLVLLAYAIRRADPVFVIGQASGILIYGRNLYFVAGRSRSGVQTAGAPRDSDS